MEFYFHEAAEAELLSAIEYYEKCEIGLGSGFPKKSNLQFFEYAASLIRGKKSMQVLIDVLLISSLMESFTKS